MIELIKKDIITALFQGDFEVLVHGCNCFNKMGKGLALQIQQRIPDAYNLDQKSKRGDITKLGTIATVYNSKRDQYVVNAYTQYRWGRDTYDYDAITKCLELVAKSFPDKVIGMPRLGCGLADGSWRIVEGIIEQTMVGRKYKVYTL